MSSGCQDENSQNQAEDSDRIMHRSDQVDHRRRLAEDGSLNTRHRVPPSRVYGSTQKLKTWQERRLLSFKDEVKTKSAGDWVSTFIPMGKWLRTYKWRNDLPSDIIAGLTVGMMIIPQSMSYAKLAGLPVEYGLYSSLVPVFAYAFFGSSRQLAVGPVALLSLMLGTGLQHVLKFGDDMTDEQQAQYNALAVQSAFLMGLSYIILGLLRLGFITIFLSHAVTSGFTTGAAVIIGLSQAKYILGYDVERSDVLHELLHNIFADIDQFNYKTFLMGTSSIVALLAMKNIGKTYPKLKFIRAAGPLTVSAITILITWAANLSEKGIPIVGTIPSGMPSITVSYWHPIDSRLLQTVFSMVIVGFMESIAIAKQLASKHKYELDSSLELIGLGMANFFGAMFQSYPVTGSFSRSAVNNDSGARSGISGIVTASLVAFVLLLLTKVFEQMPMSVLAAIVISGVIGLLDYEEAMYLYRVHMFDFMVWCISCLGTMFLGVEIGLAIAVIVSLLIVIYESAYPHTAVLGRLPGSTVYRNIKQYPNAERYDGLVLCRIDAPIYFANTQHIRDKLNKYESQGSNQTKHGIKYMIIDLSPVSHVDTSALHVLHDTILSYKARGITVCFCNPNSTVMERFDRSGLTEDVGSNYFFVCVHDAVDSCLAELEDLESQEASRTAQSDGTQLSNESNESL